MAVPDRAPSPTRPFDQAATVPDGTRPFGRGLDRLLGLLDLEVIEDDVFRGFSPDEARGRVFGGQVAAQALVAAARTTAAEHTCHSLHAYFLLGGDPDVPILYRVDRIRDGRSFTTRRVVAIQHGRAIFNLSASFHVGEEGLDHQVAMPEVPAPESLPADGWGRGTVDFRDFPEPDPAARRTWFRAPGRLPDDPTVHAAVITYASDHGPLGAARHPVRDQYLGRRMMNASLDHAIWFHRPARADEWLLYTLEPISASGARGLAWGSIHARDGRLVATVSQEGLIRPVG